MALVDSLRTAASKVLKAVGGDVVVRRVTQGIYNTTKGTISESTSDTTVKGLVENVNSREVNELVRGTDKRLTIAASSLDYTPTTTDRILVGGVVHQIVAVRTEEQNNIAISYEFILRA
jgi:hypothetical protein